MKIWSFLIGTLAGETYQAYLFTQGNPDFITTLFPAFLIFLIFWLFGWAGESFWNETKKYEIRKKQIKKVKKYE